MEIKRNEATINRPQGDRVIDAPFVFMDLPAFIRQIKKEKTWKESDRNGITVFKSEGITVVLTALRQEAKMSDSTVDGFLFVQVLDGNAEISTAEGEFTIKKNQAVTFHPGIHYSITTSTEAIFLFTTFYPIKDAY